MAVYPRKQTVVILVVCILAVGGVAFYVRGDSSGIKAPIGSELVGISLATPEALPENTNWRQQFIDKNSTSTTFKSPAKATPNEPEKLTATDLLGRSFLTKYEELQQSGLIADADSVASIMGQVTAEALAKLPLPKTFSISDIKLSASTTVALNDYGKVLTNTFGSHMPKENEAQIATEALTTNDMLILKKLDPIIEDYKSLLASLKTINTPIPLAKYHLELMNNVSLAIHNAEAIRRIDTDPVSGLAGISLGVAAMQNIASLLYEVNDYLLMAGVRIGS